MSDDKIRNKFNLKVPYKSTDLFCSNKMDEQWTEHDRKSFKDLKPKCDDDFKWCEPSEACLLFNILCYEFKNINRYLNILCLRNEVSEVGNRYISTRAIEKYLRNCLCNFDVELTITTDNIIRVPFNLPDEYRKCLKERLGHKK